MSLTSMRNAYASRRRDIDNTPSILRRRAEIMRKYDFPELRKLRGKNLNQNINSSFC